MHRKEGNKNLLAAGACGTEVSLGHGRITLEFQATDRDHESRNPHPRSQEATNQRAPEASFAPVAGGHVETGKADQFRTGQPADPQDAEALPQLTPGEPRVQTKQDSLHAVIDHSPSLSSSEAHPWSWTRACPKSLIIGDRMKREQEPRFRNPATG